eukprot:TRINITY_DN25747_c0_g1_i1.p2 TRINITY_DN25747_c0_g1~~TRINITY_DN25747_c0_g1_i1.p2  ORF type:complete len:122 (+),score=2.34 TRINITY_DN25747_c0_g1_i1:481-846(+)
MSTQGVKNFRDFQRGGNGGPDFPAKQKIFLRNHRETSKYLRFSTVSQANSITAITLTHLFTMGKDTESYWGGLLSSINVETATQDGLPIYPNSPFPWFQNNKYALHVRRCSIHVSCSHTIR